MNETLWAEVRGDAYRSARGAGMAFLLSGLVAILCVMVGLTLL